MPFVRMTCCQIMLGMTLAATAGMAQAGPEGNPFMLRPGNETSAIQDTAVSDNGTQVILLREVLGRKVVRRLNALGQFMAPDLTVDGKCKSVAIDRGGNFAVACEAVINSERNIVATVYSPNGAVKVPTFRVSEQFWMIQENPVVAMNAAGEMAFTWSRDNATPGIPQSGYMKRFRADGTPVGPQVLFTTNPNIYQIPTDIAIDAVGRSVVTWNSRLDNFEYDVYMSRFNASGQLVQTARVNTVTAGQQVGASIGMNSLGNYVIVWRNQSSPTTWDSQDVHAQRYNSNGATVGSNFVVNSTTQGQQHAPDVSMTDDGSFVVTFISGPANGFQQPMMRQFRPDGTPWSSETVIHNNSGQGVVNNEHRVWVKADNAGRAFAAYMIDGGAIWELDDAYGRFFRLDTLPPITALTNGQPVTGLAGATGSWKYFRITVPAGKTVLNVSMSGGTGDADVYLRFAGLPNASIWDARPYLTGNNESFSISGIPPGDWYVAINGYSAYSGVVLTVNY